MTSKQNEALGTAILRISLGVVYLAHSVYLKLIVFTLPGTVGFFEESLGLPAFLAYVVFAAEAVGGAALVLGVHTRVVAAALVPIALGATWAHLGNSWLFSAANGGWEYPLFLAITTTALAFLGDGAWALKPARR